jgi:flagellar motor switch protein FliN/FliY
VNERALIQAMAEELGSVIGALLDAPGATDAATAVVSVQWAVGLTFGGPSAGTVVVGFDLEGAQSLARQVMALDEAPPEAAVTDTLQEVCGQALGAVSQRTGFQGLRLIEAKIAAAPPATSATTMTITAGERLAMTVACWANIETVKAAAPAASPAPAPLLAAAAPANLDLILDIDLPLTVRFGETEMTLQALTRLAPGSVIDLGRSPDDPVDVLVNGRLVARGEVVVVSGNYGVRILEVISAADRLRTVAA